MDDPFEETPRERSGGRSGRTAALVLGLLLLVVVVALVLVLGGEDDDGGEEVAAACEEVAAAEPKQLDLPGPDAKQPTASAVEIATNCGSFTITLDAERAPKTAASFQYLAEEGAFDGTPFHRIVPGFVIQGGDPNADGTGGPGYSVTERPPRDLIYERGIVAMAKTEAEPPGTSGSQFFVVTAPADAGLDPDFALVGEVTEGFEVVEAISELADPSGAGEGPVTPVVIETATVKE